MARWWSWQTRHGSLYLSWACYNYTHIYIYTHNACEPVSREPHTHMYILYIFIYNIRIYIYRKIYAHMTYIYIYTYGNCGYIIKKLVMIWYLFKEGHDPSCKLEANLFHASEIFSMWLGRCLAVGWCLRLAREILVERRLCWSSRGYVCCREGTWSTWSPLNHD